jgi:hypothetical protein
MQIKSRQRRAGQPAAGQDSATTTNPGESTARPQLVPPPAGRYITISTERVSQDRLQHNWVGPPTPGTITRYRGVLHLHRGGQEQVIRCSHRAHPLRPPSLVHKTEADAFACAQRLRVSDYRAWPLYEPVLRCPTCGSTTPVAQTPREAPATPYAELTARPHDEPTTVLGADDEPEQAVVRRYVGGFTVHYPDGSETTGECAHQQPGRAVPLYLHGSQEDALRCARTLLTTRHGRIEIREHQPKTPADQTPGAAA